MRIEELHLRLIDVARQRVRSGQITERGLARSCNISQPHLHNALKGIRALSPASADRLMQALGLTVPELLWRNPGEIERSVKAVPVVRSRIGPGGDAALNIFRGFLPLPGSLVAGIVEPVAARLSPDLVLPAALAPNDLVLLDQNPAIRENPAGDRGCWVVSEAAGLRVRYVKSTEETQILLASGAAAGDPGNWYEVAMQGRHILEVVRARIVWILREMETETTGPAEQAGQSN